MSLLQIKETTGNVIPVTTWEAFPFNSIDLNEDTAYSLSSGVVTVSIAGNYLITAVYKYTGGSSRFESQGRVIISGAGSCFTSLQTGYKRNSTEVDCWVRITAYAYNMQAGDTITFQHRRDKDASITGTVAGLSTATITNITTKSEYIFSDSVGGQTFGTTTPSLVNIDSTQLSTDTKVSLAADTMTLAAGKYLILWCISGRITNDTRTYRVGQLEYDSTPSLGSRASGQVRDADNEFSGFGAIDIIDISSSTTLQLKVWLGDGVAADQGGAVAAGTWSTVANESSICILELTQNAKIYKSVSTNSLLLGSSTEPNIFNSELITNPIYEKQTELELKIIEPSTFLVWANAWVASHTVSSGTRCTFMATLKINGVAEPLTQHGDYIRNKQEPNNVFGGSAHPGAILNLSANDLVRVDVSKNVSTGGGGDVTLQPGTASFMAVDIQSLANMDLSLQTSFTSASLISSAELSGVFKYLEVTFSSELSSLNCGLTATMNFTLTSTFESTSSEENLELRFKTRELATTFLCRSITPKNLGSKDYKYKYLVARESIFYDTTALISKTDSFWRNKNNYQDYEYTVNMSAEFKSLFTSDQLVMNITLSIGAATGKPHPEVYTIKMYIKFEDTYHLFSERGGQYNPTSGYDYPEHTYILPMEFLDLTGDVYKATLKAIVSFSGTNSEYWLLYWNAHQGIKSVQNRDKYYLVLQPGSIDLEVPSEERFWDTRVPAVYEDKLCQMQCSLSSGTSHARDCIKERVGKIPAVNTIFKLAKS